LAATLLSHRGAALSSPVKFWLIKRIASDRSGHVIAQLLSELEVSKTELAEETAERVWRVDSGFSPVAREAACRWAARINRWDLLASLAERITAEPIKAEEPAAEERYPLQIDRDEASDSGPKNPRSGDQWTVHSDRLLAEALTRTGRGKQALELWKRVIDQGEAADFATLLRCAELAIAHAPLAEAKRRLGDAEQSIEANAGTRAPVDASRQTLLHCLRGELAVRQARFPEARQHYETVVRASESSRSLRGRAQWMIGETFFMQRQYRDAIQAYRLVENLDPGGAFGALALVQAGKSYEQLGRTAEAGVCYGLLLRRHANSPQAGEARRRLVALPQEEGTHFHR
ncbi:MAG: tetratricopeptide repeat protein, partial [Planctomycetota bacterium]